MWRDAGYNGEGKGKDWVEKVLGWTAQKIVKRPRRWVRVPKDEEPPPYPKGFIDLLPRGGGWWSGRFRGYVRTGG